MTEPAEKAAFRARAEANRRALRQALPGAGLAISDSFHSALTPPAGAVVAGYLPTRDEADPLPLVEALRARGHVIALPRVTGTDAALAFHLWRGGAAPVPGRFGLLEPEANWPETVPDIVLVPLLAFDRDGHRLGYGGGFYDRSLKALRERGPVVAVGIAFSGQEVAELPRGPYDEKLDWIVTETRARRFTD